MRKKALMPFFFEIVVCDKSDDAQKDKLSMLIFGAGIDHLGKFRSTSLRAVGSTSRKPADLPSAGFE
jgi:hypothetical protein